ncbi:MAG: PKD domain-containing protein [Saprospiraceae bacterium]
MKYIKLSMSFIMVALIAIFIASCADDRFDLPTGTIPDETPPEASFSFSPSEANYQEVSFANASISATTYAWDFGDGNTSTDTDPTHTYAADGEYTVTLTASDGLGQTSTSSQTFTLVEPIVSFTPEILNSGFDIEGADSYRDNWRNGDLGGVIQITSSPIHDGVKAAKLPSDGDRIGYQLITVQENTDYTIDFYYTMKTSPVGTVEVSVLAGHIVDPAAIAGATISNVSLNDQSSSSDYVAASISFNSGSNTEVALYFTNTGNVESRLDSFSITVD